MPKLKTQKKTRIQLYREARAIIAIAALESWERDAPNYYKIAERLGLDRKAAHVADEIWNASNGPDEGQQTEENALEHVVLLLRMEDGE